MDRRRGARAGGVLIVDAHNDLLLELDHRRDEPDPFGRHWLTQLRDGGVALQVCPVFAAEPDWAPDALRRTLGQVAAFERAVREHSDEVVAVRTRADLDDGRLGLMLSMEGVEALGDDPALIDVFWRLGVRMVSLTHNPSNAFADGLDAADDRGLSALGRELVERLVALGCAIDLAHASPRTFDAVLELVGSAPVLVSHAGCRAIRDVPRNLHDDQLRALAARGGVLGVMALPFVVDPARPTIERLVDHVEHAVEIAGIDHVGLGADFIAQVGEAIPGLLPDGEWEIEGLRGPDGYPALLDALQRRGFAGHAIAQIAGGNLLRLLGRALPTG
jgi:membrane dipeptidase